MTVHPFFNQDIHGPFETYALGDLALENGSVLPECILAYSTFGTLSPAKDNAILVTTWFSGTSKIMEQAYIGPGRALDPARYFIVVVNQIGNGLSTSPHNAVPQAAGPHFPAIRIADDVSAQHRLLTEKFGISKLALIMGGSMGAEQALEWGVRFPDSVERIAAIAGTARTTTHCALYAQTLMDAITSDPNWNGGAYEAGTMAGGLRRHAHLWAVMGASPAMYVQEAWKPLGFSSANEFVEGLLTASFQPLDPNSLLVQGRKWQQADVARGFDNDLAEALGRITAKTFIMPVSADMFFTVADCKSEQSMIPRSELRVLQSDWGHIAVMGMDPNYMTQVDAALLELLS